MINSGEKMAGYGNIYFSMVTFMISVMQPVSLTGP